MPSHSIIFNNLIRITVKYSWSTIKCKKLKLKLNKQNFLFFSENFYLKVESRVAPSVIMWWSPSDSSWLVLTCKPTVADDIRLKNDSFNWNHLFGYIYSIFQCFVLWKQCTRLYVEYRHVSLERIDLTCLGWYQSVSSLVINLFKNTLLLIHVEMLW